MNLQPPVLKIPHPRLEDFRHFAEEFNEQRFDHRYFPAFVWFKDYVPSTPRILNIGCSVGRETFALLWYFKAIEALGIDHNRRDIVAAKRLAAYLRDFNRDFYRHILPSLHDADDKALVEYWYDKTLPESMRANHLPTFAVQDAADSFRFPDDSFDLIYGRYVLFQIADQSHDKLVHTLTNITRLVKAETGRIVIVEPTRRDNISYDLTPLFFNAGLTLLKSSPTETLGNLEWAATLPRGAIYTK